MSPRQVAYQILYRVIYEGAYSNILLNDMLDRESFNVQERGFITELVYGVLTQKMKLESYIKQHSTIAYAKISKKIRILLMMAFYQIKEMDIVTEFAAVDETVKLAKQYDKRGAGFVNGLLRTYLRDNQPELKLPSDRIDQLSINYSLSSDIVEEMISDYGFEETKSFLASSIERPHLWLRVRPAFSVDKIRQSLSKQDIQTFFDSRYPNMIRTKGLRQINKQEAFIQGAIVVQDLSTVRAVNALDIQPGMEILDVCAAPGGKTFYMADLLGGSGNITANDIHSFKVKRLKKEAHRLNLSSNMHFSCRDASLLNRDWMQQFDRVLVDVPCSGLGIIRRKPEIRYKKVDDFKHLPDIQMNILQNAFDYVKVNGLLLYATCTMRKKENEWLVQHFLEKESCADLQDMQNLMMTQQEGDQFFYALIKKRAS